MAPLPEEEIQLNNSNKSDFFSHPTPGDEVVISGISGSFPDSDGMYMFRDKLLAKQDLVSGDARRWKLDHPEIPARTGKIYNIEKFDASFFGVHAKQAETMDPMLRVALERSFEAIVDAGVNPEQLKGTRCGVFVGTCFSESEKTWYYEKMNYEGQGITGCTRAILPNRISYWLGVEGPSYVVDTACSSSLYALEHAYKAIRLDLCETAIVAGANLCLHPYVSLQFNRLGVLSPDGKCKCFDYSADGYCRAEAIPVVFLQKSKNAKRVYAQVVHAKSNCDGFKDQGITFPGRQTQLALLNGFYEECGVDPSSISFVEAHGTGTRVGDPEECNTLDEVFCQGREGPLYIGSVKSNMGHSEPSSGLCSVAKVIIAMETGLIPPNLNYKSPREGIPGLPEGRLKVVTEPTPLPGGKVGVNSFGFGGANCHVLLEWNKKVKKNKGVPNDNVPRLVTVSGRTKDAVETILNDLKGRPLDAEYVALLNEVFSSHIHGHYYRGYSILTHGGEKYRSIKPYRERQQRPNVTYIFSGLSSHCSGIGKAFFKINSFSATIEKLQSYLKNKEVDLIGMLLEDDTKQLNSALNSVLCTVSVQIAFVDMLSTVGITPDGILSHSVGELASAYADRCITAEQAILAAYEIGKSLEKTAYSKKTVNGDSGKIKVNRNFDQINNNGDIINDNKPDFTFVTSRENLLNVLQKIFLHPRPRSQKWIRSNLEKKQLSSSNGGLFSAEYLLEQLISCKKIDSSLQYLSAESVIVEIAPEPVLKPYLEKFPYYTEIMSESFDSNSALIFLKAIGRMYELGCRTVLNNFYPPVNYPVSRGTPMISPLIRWDHSKDWFVMKFSDIEAKGGVRKVYITLVNEEYQYLTGHVIDGRNLYPATGYIQLVVESMRKMVGELAGELQVVFENVKFTRATSIPKKGQLDFTISIQKSSGKFEILEGGVVIVTGEVYMPESLDNLKASPSALIEPEKKDGIPLSNKDIYKELRLRGYNYSGLFRGLVSLDPSGQTGKIAWNENFVSFIDNMLQIQIMNYDNRDLFVPISIQRLIIDYRQHVVDVQKAREINEENPVLPITYYKDVNIIKAGGVEVWDLRAQQIPRKRITAEPVLENYGFLPYNLPNNLSLADVARVCMHIVLENVQMLKVKVVEVADQFVNEDSLVLAPLIVSILSDLPLIQQETVVLTAENDPKTKDLGPGITLLNSAISNQLGGLLIIASQLLQRQEFYQQVVESVKDNGYLLLRESVDEPIDFVDLNIVVNTIVGNERILLLNKQKTLSQPTVIHIPQGMDFTWINSLKKVVATNTQCVLVAENDPFNGILGLFNCLRKEPGGEKLRCIYIKDKSAPLFDLADPFYSEQFKKDLAVNVYENGAWGSYRHQLLPPLENVDVKHVTVSNSVKGDLSSFQILEGPIDTHLANCFYDHQKENYVKVCYASINFKDIMIASGKLAVPSSVGNASNEIGLEYCGWDSNGRRVMGMLPNGALTSILIPDPDLMWEIPSRWSMIEAASIPCVYFTCYVALFINGKARKGESILIHSAAGGIGIAALNLSTYLGLDIFVTVGTEDKREFIRKNFPHIPESHIGNSRDLSFEKMIAQETQGRGVDLVLNSLAEDKLLASLRCVAEGGRFLEIGKFDFANNNPLPLESFRKNISFHSVMVDIVLYGNKALKMRFKDYFSDILKKDIIKPLPTTVFELNEVEQAFRHMTAGKHIGKVVLRVRQETEKENEKIFSAAPRFFCIPSHVYIVVGGLGGFGLELVNWLIERGATKIVITSRTGIKNGYQSYRTALWKKIGIQIYISTEDVSSETGVIKLFKEALQIGPVAAVYNLAVVLKDALFENQTEEDFRLSYAGKAIATELLDKVSRNLCPDLKHFVAFSSVVCGRGNAGQANYGMANSVMERICERRRADGLPGLAVQWGAVGQVGLVADMQESNKELVIGGTLQQSIASCLSCLDKFLLQDQPVVASMVVAEKKSLGSGALSLVQAISEIIGIRDLKTVSHQTNLSELGMDSMMAVEIKQTIEREFEIFLTAQDLRSMTFAKLAEWDKKLSSGAKIETTQEAKHSGLDMFIRVIVEEEVARVPVFEMNEVDADKGVTFFIPGLDGIPSVFNTVTKNLQTKALCLMYPYEEIPSSILEISSHMYPHVISNLKLKTFNIVGYSMGSLAALELAFKLENEGYQGNIICIDGAPALFHIVTESLNIARKHHEDIYNYVLVSIFETLVEKKISTVEATQLSKLATFDEKFSYLEGRAPDLRSRHSVEHLKQLLSCLAQRLVNVINYRRDSKFKLRSKIILLKAQEHVFPEMKPDYDLQQYTEQPVETLTLSGNHITILESPNLLQFLNEIPR